ncbi:MAG TPA: U32 family peptidase, partial [Gemmatales bacterium]|nr:U32 family peptidase [Gemmatales bacterium]
NSFNCPKLGLLVRTMSQLRYLLQQDQSYWPSMVYCDFEDVRQYREAVSLCNHVNLPVALATLRIIKPGEESWLKLIASYKPHAILARNLTSVAYYSKYNREITLLGDFSLNIVNEITSYWILQQGLTRLTPGFDLNWQQLQALVHHSNAAIYEVVIHYHMPMFHNEHCVFAALLSQGKDWRDCGRPCDRHQVQLRDRSGVLFPVLADAGCRNTIYNALPQSAAEYIPAMLQLGIRHYRIELLKEDPSEITPLLKTYWSILRGEDDGKSAWRKLQVTQQLGVTRGTLQLV